MDRCQDNEDRGPLQPSDGWKLETDYDNLRLVIGSQENQDYLSLPNNEILQDLFRREFTADQVDRFAEELQQVYAQAENGPFDPAQFAERLRPLGVVDDCLSPFFGIGGSPTIYFLLDRFEICRLESLKGKIRDYIYVPATKMGHLAVDMEIICEGRREFLHWDIDARLTVHQRQPDTDDPFPGVDLVLGEGKRDPGQNGSIWQRGLDLKLHAKGCEVDIHRVHQRINDGPLVLLPPVHEYYTSTPTSCVDLLAASLDGNGPSGDLLAAGSQPPTTYRELRRFLEDGSGRPLYCLGRCGHPYIVNSGE